VSTALYDSTAQVSSQELTQRYSTSFSLATRSFAKPIRRHIYNIYGLVRIADEIVDTYAGSDAVALLDALETEIYAAMSRRYSPNMVVHAFALTANQFSIGKELIAPFFASMRWDAPGAQYDPGDYQAYIHGSAEVIGLMCLRVFCDGNDIQYDKLKTGAIALGAAFQKINFLRDLADDHERLGRYYFPVDSFETFDDDTKQVLIADIRHDISIARPTIQMLPASVRPAVVAATSLYLALLDMLDTAPAAAIKTRRLRVSNGQKMWLFTRAIITRGKYV
jgi:phytoene synthase